MDGRGHQPPIRAPLSRHHRSAGFRWHQRESASIRSLRFDDRRLVSSCGALFAAPRLLRSRRARRRYRPTLLGVSKDWSAFTSGSGSAKICYAMSKPTATEPKKAKRDPIYFLITDWPGRTPRRSPSPRSSPAISTRTAARSPPQVGSDKFEFFTKNDGGAGAAWVRERADESAPDRRDEARRSSWSSPAPRSAAP